MDDRDEGRPGPGAPETDASLDPLASAPAPRRLQAVSEPYPNLPTGKMMRAGSARLTIVFVAVFAALSAVTELQAQRSILVVPNDTAQIAQTYTRYVAAALDDLGYGVERGDRPDGWRSFYEVTVAAVDATGDVRPPGERGTYTAVAVFNWTGIQEDGMEVRSPPHVAYVQWGLQHRGLSEAAQLMAEAVAEHVDRWERSLER